jgi:hypothetical protein
MKVYCLQKMFTNLCAIPKKILCSSAYSISGEEMIHVCTMKFLIFLSQHLHNYYILQFLSPLTAFYNLLEIIIKLLLGC